MPKGLYPEEVKQKARLLRMKGYCYPEIRALINYPIPKNTFTNWFKNLNLSDKAKARIKSRMELGGSKGRAKAWESNRKKRENLLIDIYRKADLGFRAVDRYSAKLCLAMLYLGEGYKVGEIIRFGNSDPKVIKIFLSLFRIGFDIEESRLRAHVQCRADQSCISLEKYWSELTDIPLSQFYKTVIDKRTIGIPTKRANYRGVLVVEYFSNKIFLELKYIADIIYERLNKKGP